MSKPTQGIYRIAFNARGDLLTLFYGHDDALINLFPPGNKPGEQEWELIPVEGGAYFIRNIAYGTFVSYINVEGQGGPLVANRVPREWFFEESSEPGKFIIRALSLRPGPDLVASQSPLLIYPPQANVEEFNRKEPQVWRFERKVGKN